MSSRLAGAVLALTAAVLLAAAIVIPIVGTPEGFGWWAGHPAVDGRTIETKTVSVGLLGGTGCNTGGDGVCSKLSLSEAFTTTAYVELGVSGLLALGAFGLGALTIANSDRRKGFAKLTISIAILAAIVGVAMIVQGPKVKTSQHVVIPIGYGMFLFWAGTASSILGALLARRPTPGLKLRASRQAFAAIQPSREVFAPAPASREMFAPSPAPPEMNQPIGQDPPRPTPNPRPMVSSPGGSLAGPAGPLGPMHAPATSPLFPGSPQLRPLYDASVAQGGTDGYVPAAPVPPRAQTPVPPRPQTPVPPRAHTPVPRVAVSLAEDIRTPPPFNTPEPNIEPPRTITKEGAAAVPDPPVRSRGPTTPPPRLKPLSIAPPPPIRSKAPSVAPPPSARTKAASIAPPFRPTPSPLSRRTIGTSVAPPPSTVSPPEIKPPVLPEMLPVRADTDDSDHMETVDRDAPDGSRFDAAATMARDAVSGPTSMPPNAWVGDRTDTALPLVLSTGEQRAIDARPSTETDDLETMGRERVSASDLQTSARERLSTSDLSLTNEVARSVIGQRGAPEIAVPRFLPPLATPPNEPKEPPPEARKSKPIPVTTAPDSLPPPREKQAATSGPSPACPQCEAPMAWVEEHLRFYCKSCRMYF